MTEALPQIPLEDVVAPVETEEALRVSLPIPTATTETGNGSPTGRLLPLPPYELAVRVGCTFNATDFWKEWLLVGQLQKQLIESYLPPGWAEDERRVLDFGCGPGRTLRSLGSLAASWEVWGCDIHPETVAWLKANLSPPFHFFGLTDEPSIPRPDNSFDLAWGLSVFTHITDDWSAWLLELHRVLKPDGLALLTVLSGGMSVPLMNEPWQPDVFGMNCLRKSQSWDLGGPVVFHSEWWLRAHWGRLFDVLRVDDNDQGHGLVLLRKREIKLTRAELEAPEPNEPREFRALRHNIDQLHREEIILRSLLEKSQEECQRLEEENAALRRTWSWRLTRPLRGVRALMAN